MNKWLENRNVVRIVSLLFAVALWFLVNYDSPRASTGSTQEPLQTTYTIENVQLQVRYDKTQFELVEATKSVNLAVSGHPRDLSRLDTYSYEVLVDAAGRGAGNLRLPVQISGFPNTLRVVAIPDTVSVQLAAKERKQMPVKVDLIGKVAEGYQAGDPVVNPSRVHVIGSERQLAQVAEVHASLNLESSNEAIRADITLRAVDKEGKQVDLEISPAVVEVEVPVTSPSKKVPLHVELLNQPPSGYSVSEVTQSPPDILLYGSPEALQNYDFYTGAEIDLSALRSDRSMQVTIPLAQGLVKTEPNQMEVFVRVVPSQERVLEGIPIRLSSLPAGLTASLVEPAEQTITLRLAGAPEHLAEVEKESIEAMVDLSNQPAGEHELSVGVNLPQFITLVGEPPKVRVRLE